MEKPTQPRFKVTITHSAVDYVYENEAFPTITVTRVENGIDVATLHMADFQSEKYEVVMSHGDAIKIEFKNDDNDTYKEIFDGIIESEEAVTTPTGVMLQLECAGCGYGFMRTVCGEEYGAMSNKPTVNTGNEIITDATHGIVPLWVNKILGTASASGYNYNTSVAGLTENIDYLYYPYVPCHEALNTLMDVETAIKGSGVASTHWRVDTNNYLLVKLLTGSIAPGVATWYKYYNNSASDATVEEGVDFAAYHFQKLEPEANYILYHGRLVKPMGERWTEGTDADTAYWTANGTASVTDQAAQVVGATSIELGIVAPGEDWVRCPQSDQNWEIDKWGGVYNIPYIEFYHYYPSGSGLLVVDLRLVTGAVGNADYFHIDNILPATQDVWQLVRFPIGPYHMLASQGENEGWSGWSVSNNADWNDIDSIYFFVDSAEVGAGNDGFCYVDNLHFSGWILRGAKATTNITDHDVRFKVITDNVAKDDTGSSGNPGTTDTGLMARLAYAELLRSITTPTVGWFVIPMAKELKPGHWVHVHAKKKAGGSFTIDKDFRVTKVAHAITENGCLSQVHVTDDTVNSRPRTAFDDFNYAMSLARPEFQDRQSISYKTRDIDITQALLEESYAI